MGSTKIRLTKAWWRDASDQDLTFIRKGAGADIGSDHGLVMITFRVRLKKTRKPNQPRLRFDLEKSREPDGACTFQATIGGKFAPLIGLRDDDMDVDTMITTNNTAMTDAACVILRKERRRKKPSSNLSSHNRGCEHLWWSKAFSSDVLF